MAKDMRKRMLSLCPEEKNKQRLADSDKILKMLKLFAQADFEKHAKVGVSVEVDSEEHSSNSHERNEE